MLLGPALLVFVAFAAGSGPLLVVSDPDTALISPDPGRRIIDALAASRGRLDACASGLEAWIEMGADPFVDFEYGADGTLVSVRRPPQADAPKGLLARYACFERVLRGLKVGPAQGPRRGTLFFKASGPWGSSADPAADAARVEKTEAGVTVAVTGRREATPGGRFGIALEAIATNADRVPRGVRERFLYAHVVRTADDGRSAAHSDVLNTDTSAPVVCLKPGESLRASLRASDRDAIGPGGRSWASPFLEVGDCARPHRRVMVGGFRLDWTDKRDAPRIVAVPYWFHAVDPFTPRPTWR